MRAVLQRVTRARVRIADTGGVAGEAIGAIKRGLLVYLGVASGDTPAEAQWLALKIAELRMFPSETADTAGIARSMGRSVIESGGAVLLVSQFTLLADTRKGRRPSFFEAAAPDVAEPLVEAVASALRVRGIQVATGRFGAHMLVESENDGPVTITLDSASG